MANPQKGTGLVTALSTVGMVFGVIGMLGSFIPCFGAMAFYISLPATIISGVGAWLAYNNRISIGLPIAAVTISAIGLIISGLQIMSLSSFSR